MPGCFLWIYVSVAFFVKDVLITLPILSRNWENQKMNGESISSSTGKTKNFSV